VTQGGHAILRLFVHSPKSKNYKTILTVLFRISERKNENGYTKYDAKVLLKKETDFLCLFWNDILQHCNNITINKKKKLCYFTAFLIVIVQSACCLISNY